MTEGCRRSLILHSVVASKPKTMQEAIEMATDLMDRRINTLAENKRKLEDTPRNNQNQQPNKRQNTGRAYAAGNARKLGHLAKTVEPWPATAKQQQTATTITTTTSNNNRPMTQGANTNAINCFECGLPGTSGTTCP
ncbi:hypothetical protein Tco_0590890 [Tanacetum coccineum]